jgi:hypothetical protein
VAGESFLISPGSYKDQLTVSCSVPIGDRRALLVSRLAETGSRLSEPETRNSRKPATEWVRRVYGKWYRQTVNNAIKRHFPKEIFAQFFSTMSSQTNRLF